MYHQSYGGGRDIVGLGDDTLLKGAQFKRAPIFDDGLIEVPAPCSPFCVLAFPCVLLPGGRARAPRTLAPHRLRSRPSAPPPPCLIWQVVGFGSGWHAAAAMSQVSSKLHAVRLAQCCEVELTLVAHGKVRRGAGWCRRGDAPSRLSCQLPTALPSLL